MLALCLHYACTMLALCLHYACTMLALCLHYACTVLALCLHYAYTMLALCGVCRSPAEWLGMDLDRHERLGALRTYKNIDAMKRQSSGSCSLQRSLYSAAAPHRLPSLPLSHHIATGTTAAFGCSQSPIPLISGIAPLSAFNCCPSSSTTTAFNRCPSSPTTTAFNCRSLQTVTAFSCRSSLTLPMAPLPSTIAHHGPPLPSATAHVQTRCSLSQALTLVHSIGSSASTQSATSWRWPSGPPSSEV
jgi:hypothetical protein